MKFNDIPVHGLVANAVASRAASRPTSAISFNNHFGNDTLLLIAPLTFFARKKSIIIADY